MKSGECKVDIREEGSTLIYQEGLGTLITSMKSGGCKVDVRSVCVRAFRGEISLLSFKFPLPNNNKVCGCFSHFLFPQKQFPPQNYISGKKTLNTREEGSTLIYVK